MKPEIKEKWLTALRSGKYQQTSHSLRDDHGRGVAFCCLGVLCDVSGAVWHGCEPVVDDADWGRMDEAYLSDTALDAVGLTEAQQATLARMNDEGATFLHIADYIETRI